MKELPEAEKLSAPCHPCLATHGDHVVTQPAILSKALLLYVQRRWFLPVAAVFLGGGVAKGVTTASKLTGAHAGGHTLTLRVPQ